MSFDLTIAIRDGHAWLNASHGPDLVPGGPCDVIDDDPAPGHPLTPPDVRLGVSSFDADAAHDAANYMRDDEPDRAARLDTPLVRVSAMNSPMVAMVAGPAMERYLTPQQARIFAARVLAAADQAEGTVLA